MIKHGTLSKAAAALGLGLTLLTTGACNSAGSGSGAAAPSAAPSSAAGNTAEICASGGAAARDVVVGLFAELAAAAEGGEPDPAELSRIHRDTFGKLGDDLGAEAARATDPGLAAVLEDIAAEADKLAAAPDLGNEEFRAALDKLDEYCPSGKPSSAGTAPGGVIDGAVGAAGSGCELPVTFSVAEKWKPKAVDAPDDDPLVELARKGPLRLICEIDSKPAGHLGFIRVWLDKDATGDARAALRPFVTGGKTRNVAYTPFTAGGRDATEITFEEFSALFENYVRRRAFAVPTPAGAVVVELGGLDSEEHDAMLPAYELAKRSLAVRP